MIVRSTAACTCRGGAAAYQADPRAIHACGRCEAHLHEEWADDTAVVHGADIVGKRSDSLRRVQAAGSGPCVCRQRWRIDWRTPARLRSASVSAIRAAGAGPTFGWVGGSPPRPGEHARRPGALGGDSLTFACFYLHVYTQITNGNKR